MRKPNENGLRLGIDITLEEALKLAEELPSSDIIPRDYCQDTILMKLSEIQEELKEIREEIKNLKDKI